MSLLSAEFKALIGREVHYPALDPVSAAGIRYFALATGDLNPLYCNDAVARALGYPSRIAPPTYVVEQNQYAHRLPRSTGYIAHEWEFPAGDFQSIRGGNRYRFMRNILPGDEISVTYRIDDIVEKRARSGSSMLLITSSATYTDQTGAVVATNEETLFLKPLEGNS